MWTITLAAVLVVLSVHVGGRAGEETECPFLAGPWQNEINQAETKLGISLTDLADGNIFEVFNASTLVEKCKQTNNADIFKWLQIIGEHINRCNYGDTKKRLDAFNIDGVKKAFELICKNKTNLKVLEDKSACLEDNRDEISKCHADGMKKATAASDIMYKKCSNHRLHAYCARTVLAEKCGKDLARMKEEAARLIFPPTCDCELDTKRKDYQEARAKDCVKDKDCWSHNKYGHLLESQIQNGVLFGARNIDMMEDLCKKESDAQDAKPKIVSLLGTCFDRGTLCTYPVQKYKLMLINMDGMKKAAGMMCEKMADFKEEKECIEEQFSATRNCYENALKKIKTDLTAAGKFNDMKEVVCRRNKMYQDCIETNFGNCNVTVETVKKMANERVPRMCNCENIGYNPDSAGNDVIRSASVLTTITMFLCTYIIKQT